MTGKVQDLLSAAVVIGATERTSPMPKAAPMEAGSAGSIAEAPVAQPASMPMPKTPSPLEQPAVKVELSAQEGQDMPSVEETVELQRMEAAFQEKEQAKRADAQQERERMDEASVSLMTKQLNELMSKINCNLKFNYHEEVGVMSVQMIDKKTDEVLKELPPEEMIQNMIKTRDWIGAFLDKKA